jgi:hypothetical protein
MKQFQSQKIAVVAIFFSFERDTTNIKQISRVYSVVSLGTIIGEVDI